MAERSLGRAVERIDRVGHDASDSRALRAAMLEEIGRNVLSTPTPGCSPIRRPKSARTPSPTFPACPNYPGSSGSSTRPRRTDGPALPQLGGCPRTPADIRSGASHGENCCPITELQTSPRSSTGIDSAAGVSSICGAPDPAGSSPMRKPMHLGGVAPEVTESCDAAKHRHYRNPPAQLARGPWCSCSRRTCR